ncbi:hypothetical protein DUI87_07239 [Hirundo rustica rustica]|uniref:Uncharacterized protein n=1 Tax=Hirundo rustica rustica TaxID=333673 RepID=A0A3M0KPA6_HIRRU|nr:hypothetical protein DUI87_07239 [Hirundo rustica rustica]
MGPDGRHAWVLADVTARSLLIVFETSWGLGEVPGEWKKADVASTFKNGKEGDPGNYNLVTLTFIPGEVTEHIIMDAIFIHVKIRKSVRSIKDGFIKASSYMTNLTVFYDKNTELLKEGRTEDAYYAFIKASTAGTLKCSIFIDNLMKYGLNKRRIT